MERGHRSGHDRERSHDVGVGSRGGEAPVKAKTEEELATDRVFHFRKDVESAAVSASKLGGIAGRAAWDHEKARLDEKHTDLKTELAGREKDARASDKAGEHVQEAKGKLDALATELENAQRPRSVPAVAGEVAIEASVLHRDVHPDDVWAFGAGLSKAERSALKQRLKAVGESQSARDLDPFASQLANRLAALSEGGVKFPRLPKTPQDSKTEAAKRSSRVSRKVSTMER
jgi:hypothetical protein